MRTIYKYQVSDERNYTHQVTTDFDPVYVGLDPIGQPCVWAEIDTNAPLELRTFTVIGTGHAIPKEGEYVGTYIEGAFVWHVYSIPTIKA